MLPACLARSFKTDIGDGASLSGVTKADPATQDFASAALVGLVHRALAESGLSADKPIRQPGALLPLSNKRALLAAIADAHGLRPLLGAGRHLADMPPDPAVAALITATGPLDLFARWSRLERFVHSRHRVALREARDRHLVAEHVSDTHDPPRPSEDALILGVMAAALALIGAAGVSVRLGRGPDAPLVIDGDTILEPAPGEPTAVWRFEWRDFVPARVATAPTRADDAGTVLRQIVASDPARGWSVAAAAAMMAMSARTLQRGLVPAGGFAAVVAAVRAERAADLLINSEHPLSLIGFVCGYADQPHFTREFKRRAAMTPATYRRAFARQKGVAQ